MLDGVDLLVCGAGPVGCVVAERAARLLGWRVLVVDKRGYVAGNCHDRRHSSGVLIHRHGPHYFRTNSQTLLDYLGRFTDWTPARYEVKSLVGGKLHPFPINLDTLEAFAGKRLDAVSAQQLLDRLREPNDAPMNSREFVLSRVGRQLYESFYEGYTRKQWGIPAERLAPDVCGRIPVRLDRDGSYVNHRHQVMPAGGFTAMFRKMLRHRNIRVVLECGYEQLRGIVRPRFATVYTGSLDEYFGCDLGKLPYRSLKFDFVEYDRPFVQPCVQINYPNDTPYTRSVEIKHVTGQQHPHTVVSFETPKSRGEPYYPMPTSEAARLADRYRERAATETARRSVYFCGRLANYRYYNTDEVIEEALRCFESIRRRFAPQVVPSRSSAAMTA